MDEASRTPAALAAPTAPGPLASFARFVVCGGGVGVLSSFAVTLLALSMPWGLANAVITVASTLLCTELHARFTFGAGRRAGRREHWQSAGSAAVAYVVTCAAMFLLHLVQASPSALTEQIVYLSASGLAGLGRFLVLRLFVFATGRGTAAGTGRATEPVRESVPAARTDGEATTVTARPAVGSPIRHGHGYAHGHGHGLRTAHLPRCRNASGVRRVRRVRQVGPVRPVRRGPARSVGAAGRRAVPGRTVRTSPAGRRPSAGSL